MSHRLIWVAMFKSILALNSRKQFAPDTAEAKNINLAFISYLYQEIRNSLVKGLTRKKVLGSNFSCLFIVRCIILIYIYIYIYIIVIKFVIILIFI